MGASIRVLLCVPDLFVRKGIRYFLALEPDLDVAAEAGSVEEAVRGVETAGPDVVLLDVEAEDLPLGEVMDQMRRRGDVVRIVLLLEEVEEQYVFEGLSSGAAGFVARRDEPATLAAALREVVRSSEVWFSPAVVSTLVPRQIRAGEPAALSVREREILERLAMGQRNEEIACELGIGGGTLRNHLSHVYRKLGVRTRAEAVAWAWRNRLVHVRRPH